jgi:hypothetical protein
MFTTIRRSDSRTAWSSNVHCRAQWSRGMKHEIFLSLERWVRNFEAHLRHGCLRLFCLCWPILLVTGWSPVKGPTDCLRLRNRSETKRQWDLQTGRQANLTIRSHKLLHVFLTDQKIKRRLLSKEQCKKQQTSPCIRTSTLVINF